MRTQKYHKISKLRTYTRKKTEELIVTKNIIYRIPEKTFNFRVIIEFYAIWSNDLLSYAINSLKSLMSWY